MKRRLLPKPDPPPEGKVYMYNPSLGEQLVDYDVIHQWCKERMDRFDQLPREIRLLQKGN